MQYFVKIEKGSSGYTGSITRDNQVKAELKDIKLGVDDEVKVKGINHNLGTLVEAIIGYDSNDIGYVFDERGLLEIGEYLYRNTFSRLPEGEIKSLRNKNEMEEVNVCIVTEDEHISRLPWVLLSNECCFLSTLGWAFTISSGSEREDCELPPSPRILIIAPEPEGVEHTRAKTHIEDIINKISETDDRLREGNKIRIVYTWEEYEKFVNEFVPEIVYYYGHGVGNSNSTRLVFATGKDNVLKYVPVLNFAQVIMNMERSPRIVYVNCCQGDAGGKLGVGRQLERAVPSVITNRTVASIEVAQSQAVAFWNDVVNKGIAPHRAVANLHSKMTDHGVDTSDLRWMTPVVYCNYAKWHSYPLQSDSKQRPHWHLKIDRVTQFGTVVYQTNEMLREQKPVSRAYIWYGKKGQGIDTFHERLKVCLGTDLNNTSFHEFTPVWPTELEKPWRAFEDMLLEAFDVSELEMIPGRIRSVTGGISGKQTLVYVRHEPVTSRKVINPVVLKDYLEWWDSVLVPILGNHQFALLGISFVVEKPPLFLKAIEKRKILEMELKDTTVRLLDAMEKLARSDLLDFLRDHNIRMPERFRNDRIDKILEKTGGHYEKTVDELRELVDREWDLSEDKRVEDEQTEEEDEY
ncbi:MAG: hypothetical protein GY941_09070 [Planctomycetes bacterium]|nr:hypothetical protein [Planctomycetota bacterium]